MGCAPDIFKKTGCDEDFSCNPEYIRSIGAGPYCVVRNDVIVTTTIDGIDINGETRLLLPTSSPSPTCIPAVSSRARSTMRRTTQPGARPKGGAGECVGPRSAACRVTGTSYRRGRTTYVNGGLTERKFLRDFVTWPASDTSLSIARP